MAILVTGAAGYIGSHMCVELLEAGAEVVGIDNFDNSHPEALRRVAAITGREVIFTEGDLRDRDLLDTVFEANMISAVIHFAGLKAVGESVREPLHYFANNLGSTMTLLEAMEAHKVHKLVFSSSCTVYGHPDPARMPLTEDTPRGAGNPYGRTKLMIEQMLEDIAAGPSPWKIMMLRYFNPVGAHPSGSLGEDPAGVPENLVPYTMQVAVERRPYLKVFGGDYETPDGTCIRDYIHVVDLVRGHQRALEELHTVDGVEAVNLGTGVGSSVLQVVAAAGRAAGRDIPYEVVDRRPGDAPVVFADTTLASERLGWRAELDLDHMCADHWRWQQQNPDGYGGPPS